ncbi:MAG: polymerase subunit sigma-24 [Verrucomicrobiales bacterium]|nr:polymerase subunit sigma-24 [Verrucomicrobiales bacterium]
MQDDQIDLQKCIERVKAGEESAAIELLHHLHPVVMRIVRSHLPKRTAEEDLAQMVMIKVFRHLGQFRGEVPLQHWVSRIAVNTCIKEIKREISRPELRHADLSEEQVEVLNNLGRDKDETDSNASLAREVVTRLLETLKPADRLLMDLLYMKGHSMEEVRSMTGWNIALIKVRAFRARRKMQQQIKRFTR